MNKTLMMMMTAGVMLVIIGMILSIGAKIQTTTKENVATIGSITVNNESTAPTGSYLTLACRGDVDSPASTSISNVYNGSGANEPLESANWTLDSTTGSINFTIALSDDGSGKEPTGANLTVSYTCASYGILWSIGRNSTESLLSLSQWNSTLATVVAAIVIITLLFAGFGAWLWMRGTKEG